MHAIRIHRFGGVDVLSYEEIPAPQPGRGEVRVKIEAAGVNFIDIYQRTGAYKGAVPFTLGSEGAGVVDAVGPEVTHLKVGDRVAYVLVLGAYAEYAIVPESKLVPVPESIHLNEAVAAMVQGLTAQYLAYSTFPLKSGDTALVHAAAGGTGRLLVQAAKKLGARVIGTVGSDPKMEIARACGADEVINYTTQDFETECKRMTGGKGVDVVYDSVGKTTFDKSLNCLHPRGYMVLFGQSSGAVPPLDPQVLNAKGSLYLTRPMLAHYILDRRELLDRASTVFGWMQEGALKVKIDRTYPMAEAGQAHTYLEGRQTTGKLLLIP